MSDKVIFYTNPMSRGRIVRWMLEETGIAATPGVDFDEARGRRFVRFSYAGTTADMAEAAERLKTWRRLG